MRNITLKRTIIIFKTSALSNIKLFSTNVQLLYPLKTSEKRKLSDIFRGYRSETLFEDGLITSFPKELIEEIQKIRKTFTWNNATPKMKHETLLNKVVSKTST